MPHRIPWLESRERPARSSRNEGRAALFMGAIDHSPALGAATRLSECPANRRATGVSVACLAVGVCHALISIVPRCALARPPTRSCLPSRLGRQRQPRSTFVSAAVVDPRKDLCRSPRETMEGFLGYSRVGPERRNRAKGARRLERVER